MEAPASRIFVRSGHELLARGALDAGCQFFAAYPAPATAGLCEAMMAASSQRSLVALTAPDEATAAAYALGASMRGAKPMTATMGSGWLRIADAVEYGIGAELPLVVLVVEQLTPTRTAETPGPYGDRLLAESNVSGLSTVPVFAPSTPAECYELATAAFHWSERLRTPVILRCDRDVVNLREDVDDGALVAYPTADRPRRGEPAASRSPNSEARDVRVFSDVGGPWPTRITALPHDEQGRLTRSAEAALEVDRHTREKISARAGEMARVYVHGDAGADVVVIAFGALARTVRDTVQLARQRGRRLAAVTVLSLVPVPVERLRAATKSAKTVIVAEDNPSGHYRRLIEPALMGKRVFGVSPVERRMTPHQLLEEIEDTEWKVEYV